jgi:hypothetical protein
LRMPVISRPDLTLVSARWSHCVQNKNALVAVQYQQLLGPDSLSPSDFKAHTTSCATGEDSVSL